MKKNSKDPDMKMLLALLAILVILLVIYVVLTEPQTVATVLSGEQPPGLPS